MNAPPVGSSLASHISSPFGSILATLPRQSSIARDSTLRVLRYGMGIWLTSPGRHLVLQNISCRMTRYPHPSPQLSNPPEHRDNHVFPFPQAEIDRLGTHPSSPKDAAENLTGMCAEADLQHHVMALSLEGNHCLCPKNDGANRVLDLGTGTGIWAMEYG